MREFEFEGVRWSMDGDGAWVSFKVSGPGLARQVCSSLEEKPGKPRTVQIKGYKKRSLDANAYLWALCQRIAEAVRSTREEIYQQAVRRAGQFILIPVREDAVEAFIRHWEAQGIGWPAWVEDSSKLSGYKRLMCCFGSSVYDSGEMSSLLNEVVDEAQSLGIETLPPHRVRELSDKWGSPGKKPLVGKPSETEEKPLGKERRE